MAHRDRSANHAFMYIDIRQLLENNQQVATESAAGAPVTTSEVKTVQLPQTSSISALQNNLDRLQSLHHKLHAMLDELNKLTGKK